MGPPQPRGWHALCKAGLSNSHFKGRGTHVHHSSQIIIFHQPGKPSVLFFRQLWLVLGVKLMEINSNWFSKNLDFPEIAGDFPSKTLPFGGNRSCEVAMKFDQHHGNPARENPGPTFVKYHDQLKGANYGNKAITEPTCQVGIENNKITAKLKTIQKSKEYS